MTEIYNYVTTQVLEHSDVNSVYTEMTNYMEDLIKALTTDTAIIYWDAFGTAITSGSTIAVSHPEQYFSVAGYVGTVAASAAPLTGPLPASTVTGGQTALYLILSKTPVSGAKNKIDATGNIVSFTASDYKYTIGARAVIVQSSDSTVAPTAPTLGANDVGLVEWCYFTSTWSGAAWVHTRFPPASSTLWAFPGAAGTAYPTAHAASHITTGLDTIADVTAASSGLMSATMLGYVEASYISLVPAAGSSFMSITAAGTPKTGSIGITLDSNLVDKAGSLSVVCTGSGASIYPARSDHAHSYTALPFNIQSTVVALTGVNLGTIQDITLPANATRVIDVNLYWAPPANTEPQIPVEWYNNVFNYTVGVRWFRKSNKKLAISIGQRALTYLETAVLAHVQAAKPLATWNSADGGGHEPVEGNLIIEVVYEK